MEYIKLIRKPDINMYAGIKVTKNTNIEFENEHVKQTINNLTMHTEMTIKGEGYESVQNTIIDLKEGDALLFEEKERGYIKPVEPFVTIAEAVEELNCIKEV